MTSIRPYNWIDYTIWSALLVALTGRLYLDLWPTDPVFTKHTGEIVIDATMLALFTGFVIRRTLFRPPAGPPV